MRSILLLLSLSILATLEVQGQENLENQKKKRLDFAMNYFEYGGTLFPSYESKILENNQVVGVNNSASVMQYLNWGAMHFWGHGEFYVTFPLNQSPFNKNPETNGEIFHAVVTGARFYPWVYREKRLTPYVGANWSALTFQQVDEIDNDKPIFAKDIALAFDAGVLFGYKQFAVRLGINYLPNTTFDYPISRTQNVTIKTPPVSLNVGFLYTMDLTKQTTAENIENWNRIAGATKMTMNPRSNFDFYLAAGPSLSFSLQKSKYTRATLPYLNDQLSSGSFFELGAGVQSNILGMFAFMAFRNPSYSSEGFGAKQTIKKTSFALDVNKFIIDYNGFAPFVGVNLAYDNINYQEEVDGVIKEFKVESQFEPGITIGWDIVPGKTQEALVLRTNLRWYPKASFEVDNLKFNFSQLEYNLIQVVFYPGRLKYNKKKKV